MQHDKPLIDLTGNDVADEIYMLRQAIEDATALITGLIEREGRKNVR